MVLRDFPLWMLVTGESCPGPELRVQGKVELEAEWPPGPAQIGCKRRAENSRLDDTEFGEHERAVESSYYIISECRAHRAVKVPGRDARAARARCEHLGRQLPAHGVAQ